MKNKMHILLIVVVINLLLHADGAEIRGSLDNVVKGQNFTFICSFTTAPQIGVIFKRKLTTDKKSYDYFGFSLTGSNCVGSGKSDADPQSCTTSDLCTCTDDRKMFTLYIPSIPSSWHNSKWSCGGIFSTLSAVLTLFVTDFPTLPSGLTFGSVTASSVHVSWTGDENNSYIQTFHLSYQTEDSYKLTIDIPEEHGRRVYNVQVQNLDPGTTYRLQLTASNTRGSNFNVLSGSVTTKKITEKTKYLNDDPSTTSIALVAVSSVLFLSTVIASIINVLYFIKHRGQNSNDNGSRGEIQEMKPQISIPPPNVYEDLGERDEPVESHYLHLQQSVSSDVTSNRVTSEQYDELMARDPPSHYDKIQVDRTGKGYEIAEVK